MQVAYVPDKPWLFWLREKPEDPQFEPHAGIKMVQVLGSPLYIRGRNTIQIAYLALFVTITATSVRRYWNS